MKILKITVLSLIIAGAAGKLIGPYMERLVRESPRIVKGAHDANVSIASDKRHFEMMYEIGSAYNYLHSRPKSKEEQRELARSAELAAYLKYSRLIDKAEKDGTIISIPTGTKCLEIQRSQFRGPAPFRGDYIGIQIRILDGPHKDFEGWVFDHQVEIQ